MRRIAPLAIVGPTEKPTASSSWIVDRFGAYGRASLVLAVFAVPTVINRNSSDPFGLPKLVALWGFALFALAFYVIHAAERRVWMPRARIVMATVLFLLAFGLATAFSQAVRPSLFGLHTRYGGAFPLLSYVATMVLIVALCWEQPDRIKDVAWAVWLGAVGVAVYAVIQQAGLDPFNWYSPANGTLPQYPASTIGNSNFTGGVLAIAFPCGLYLLATAKSRHWPWLALSLGVEVLALWYTHSRGAFLAAFMSVVAVAWICRDRVPRLVTIVAAASGAVIAILAVLVVWHPWTDARPTAPGSSLFSTTSAEGRLSYWATSWRVFSEHPVVGTGPETFYATYPLHRRATAATDGTQPSLTDKPHNVFFEYAANTGVLGLGSYLLVVGMALWYGVRRCRLLTGEPQLLLAAFVGMLVAYLTQAFVSIDVPDVAFPGWVAIGAIAALADPVVVRRREQAREGTLSRERVSAPSAWRRFSVGVGTVIALVALLSLGLRALRADINAGLGRFARASELNPLLATYPLNEGLTALTVAKASAQPEEKLRELQFAVDRFERVLEIQPNEWAMFQGLAETNTLWAESFDPIRYRNAIAWWQRAVEHDPTNAPLRQAFEIARAAMERNVSELEVAASGRPDDPMAWLRAAKGRVGLGEPALARRNIERVLSLSPGDREATDILATLPP